MPHQPLSADIEECVRLCLACYRSCTETASGHCLEMGGPHVEPEHFRLMLGCAEICRATAALMLNHSPQHPLQCGVCAEYCRLCAASCREIGDMDDCVAACEACAESCERMAAGGGGARKATVRQGEPRAAH